MPLLARVSTILVCLLALAAPSAALILSPVPWLEAGFREAASGSSASCQLQSFEGCLEGGARQVDLPRLGGGPVSFSSGPIDLSADIVSRVDGHSWTYGIENIELDIPEIPDALPLEPDDVESITVSLRASVVGRFAVPEDGTSAVVPIAVANSLEPGDFRGEASELLGTGRVDHYLAGDVITILDTISWSFEVFVFDDTGELDIQPAVNSNCQSFEPGMDLSDCLVTLELYEPRPGSVPEPRLGLLLGLAVAGACAGRRARR